MEESLSAFDVSLSLSPEYSEAKKWKTKVVMKMKEQKNIDEESSMHSSGSGSSSSSSSSACGTSGISSEMIWRLKGERECHCVGIVQRNKIK